MAFPTTANEMRRARGLKRTCQNETCSSRFYDLGRVQIVCPACGAAFQPPAERVPSTTSVRRRSVWSRPSVSAPPQPTVDTEHVATDSAEESQPRFDADANGDNGVVIQDLEEDDEPSHHAVDSER